jgi:hypothetical protein
MAAVFFGSRDNDSSSRMTSVECPDLKAVKSRRPEHISGSLQRELAVGVRDEEGPVLVASM